MLNFRNKNSNKRHLKIPAKVERKIIMDTGIRAVVMEEIRELARRHGLEQVILFGSRARGDYGRASDIDLAVEGGDITGFSLDVDETTSTLLQYDFVDLGSNLQEDLRREIQRDGILLYTKERKKEDGRKQK